MKYITKQQGNLRIPYIRGIELLNYHRLKVQKFNVREISRVLHE